MSSINCVHVIFKTHLDIGFTDLAHTVIARYFDEFIPTAINVAQTLRRREGGERFVWTTGSWLIYEYLEQAGATERRQVELAIEHGDIAWHALPFTTHTELMTRSLFRHGLSLSQRLDQRFGRTTIAAKMTDVPGHTRAIVPLLAEAGVELLHIGVNPASTAPDVPNLFRWQHPGGRSLTVMYDRGDYGQTSVFPDAGAAVCFAHTRDNEPPQDEAEVLAVYAQLREAFPAAEVVGSTLCDVSKSLRDQASKLPMIDAELGDSWIYGAASDPARMTPYRTTARLYDHWLQDRRHSALDDHLDRFARHLLMVPEHTWGLMMEALDDETSFGDLDFEVLRLSEAGRKLEASWHEQREQVGQAIRALPDDLRAETECELVKTHANVWGVGDFAATTARSWSLEHFEIAINESGSLCQLKCMESKRDWAGPAATLGQFVYESFSARDYGRFFEEYVTLDVDWAKRAFCKQVPRSIEAASWLPHLTDVFISERAEGTELLMELALPDIAVQQFGAPRHVQSKWTFAKDEAVVDHAVQWFGKRATRLPTAAWISFVPPIGTGGRWSIQKLGDWVAPEEVVPGGGRMLHGTDGPVRYSDDSSSLTIESLDAAVVSPAERQLLRFHHRSQPAAGGMHFCMWNNVWNTNFPLWHDRDERFRFRLG